jgi:hypothetical protein
VFILDSLLTGGLRFVLEQIAAAADAEADDETVLRERLLDAHAGLELGTLSEEEFAAIERDILARMREARTQRVEASDAEGGDVKVTGVEVVLEDGHDA